MCMVLANPCNFDNITLQVKKLQKSNLSNPSDRLSFLQVSHERMLQSNDWYSFFESLVLRGALSEIQNKAY